MLFSERGRGESLMSASDCRVVGESAAERTGGPVENAGLAMFLWVTFPVQECSDRR